MGVIIKILCTVLVVLMCHIFISDTINHIRNKKYSLASIGVFLIIYFIYCEYNLLICKW